jgi:cobalt-zinc-cadmium efflux system membrane fusion protein
MFATVTFTETAAAEVLVPTSALVLVGDKSYVFVETGPFAFERRIVEAGEQIDHATIITSGLSAGERIVTRDALLLQ